MTLQNTPPINRIDRRLWQRFIEVALPYWYPTKKQAGIFFFMLLMLLIFLLAVLFMAIAFLTWLEQQFIPEFTTQVASSLISTREKALTDSIYQIILILALVIPAAIFGWQWRRLRGRTQQWGLLALPM